MASKSKQSNHQRKKIAIVHDILYQYGGAERVLEKLLEIYPNADLFTFYYNKNNQVIKQKFGERITSSSLLSNLQLLNHLQQYLAILKPIAISYFYFLNLKKYSLIITSSSSFNSKCINKINTNSIHICYLHTPPKYLYQESNELKFTNSFPFSLLLLPLISTLRRIDKKAAQNPNIILVNSNTVKKRVDKYYNRSSTIVFPPIRDQKATEIPKKGKYYLAHSRLSAQKGIDLIVQTCSKYKLPLVIIGTGHELKNLKKIAGPTVKFLGWVPDNRLPEIYSRAIALLYCAIDEDFGIVPVEAMSLGVPVVAFRSGAIQETITPKQTGILFSDYSTKGLKLAIDEFKIINISSNACIRQAKRFNHHNFERKFKTIVHAKLSNPLT